MTYLLDTHTLIWAVTDTQNLSGTVREILENTDNEILVSAVSFWEISLKYSLQKLTLDGLTPEDFHQAAFDTGFQLFDLTGETTSSYHQLKATHHRDPFDRMLIWLAISHNFSLISKDPQVMKYSSEGLTVVW
ncbi:type II toxin-antitoxin system VapC family toxin [Spirosoma spitsbergense]|jgi:PIN domain nuclease of toxin-antitoxin system|uniref:type II toxin-antitoxin system VapC family toxin n=1 Tax=Spirosoma spitsbergense TaxID=431554 RepID=UPI000373A61F|nr:type II toxin-antitoxin system VapC family toxin [Spirosoma spitsbergense]